jgi:hypothetical protein
MMGGSAIWMAIGRPGEDILCFVDSVGGYVVQLDRLLAAACTIFPTGEPVAAATSPGEWAQVSPPEGNSGLAAAAERADARYRDAGARVGALTDAIDGRGGDTDS